jgi:hypothetical protein
MIGSIICLEKYRRKPRTGTSTRTCPFRKPVGVKVRGEPGMELQTYL